MQLWFPHERFYAFVGQPTVTDDDETDYEERGGIVGVKRGCAAE